MKDETKCLHSGYTPENGGPGVMPIYQSTTFRFNSTQEIAAVFDDPTKAHIYSRFTNPTVDCVEKKIADLEGGVAAMCTTSGQAASLISILNLAKAGERILSTSAIYGGTVNLFAVTMKKIGITVDFIDVDATEEEIQKMITPKTKAIFGETLTNPSLQILDIERFAKVAHKNGIPLIIDNTFATPILCKPIEFGADVVIHSTTKYICGHGNAMGGIIVDSGKFDWEKSGKFKGLTEPDETYHGTIYTKAFGNAAYIVKARAQLLRDLGTCMSPFNAYLTLIGLETLHLRMKRHSESALKIAKFLESHPAVSWVNYPGLETNTYYPLVKKYMHEGASSIICFGLKKGKEAGIRFIEKAKLMIHATNIGDSRTIITYPALTTHRQLNEEQLKACGISDNFMRLSVGLEDADDIIEDLKQSLE